MDSVPLHEKVFRTLKEQILSGELKGGSALIPSRLLASQMEVSRNTVLTALDRLESEGFITRKMGSGCYVNPRLSIGVEEPGPAPRLVPAGFKKFRTDIVDFRSGLPALDAFPVHQWSGLYRDVMSEVSAVDLGYSQPEGRAELRRQIASYVKSFRGVRCTPDQILITSGTTQAIALTGRILFEESKGAAAVLEDPITSDIQEIYRRNGARLHHVPVDSMGMCTDRLPGGISPRLVYVTPSHQFPLGYIMPASRRIELIEYAKSTGAWIIEDDYDSEYRYSGFPVSSIQGLYPDGVIYIGTFSKTIAPALRIGYLVLPPTLISPGRRLKWHTDLHNSVFDQLVLARFLERHMYHRHLQKMKKLYMQRREHLLKEIDRQFGSAVEILGENAGLHVCARFPGIEFTEELLTKLEAAGVKVYPVEEHAIVKGRYKDTVIIGFGRLREDKATEGILCLKKVLLEEDFNFLTQAEKQEP